MSFSSKNSNAPLDLSRWRNVPLILIVAGAVVALIGVLVNPTQFGYCWLVAFMFFLSLGLGSLWLVIVHHLFDAGWSVPIRRFCEHISQLLWKRMIFLFIPIACLARSIYPWMHEKNPLADHALQAKQPLFSTPGFYIASIICF